MSELFDVAYVRIFHETELMADSHRCSLEGVSIEEEAKKCKELAKEFMQVYEDACKEYMNTCDREKFKAKYTEDGPYFYPMIDRFTATRIPQVFPVKRKYTERDFDYNLHVAYGEFVHDAIELRINGQISDEPEDMLCEECWKLALEFSATADDEWDGCSFFEALDGFDVAGRLKQMYPAYNDYEVETVYTVKTTHKILAPSKDDALKIAEKSDGIKMQTLNGNGITVQKNDTTVIEKEDKPNE